VSTDLDLQLPARAENVIVIRQAIAGLGEAAGMDPLRIADVKTVVTEACNNVVLHAYDEVEGPIEVSAAVEPDALELTVRDRGRGFQPSAADAAASLGLGLPLIASLSDEFAIRGGAGQGTSLSTRFALVPAAEPERAPPPAAHEGLRLEVEPGDLVRPVLARVLGALAARAEFSFERLSDTMLLGDAVSEHRPADFRGGRVAVAISDGNGSLDIRVGPLHEGGGERILSGMDLPGNVGSLRALARSVEVERRDDAEYLVLEVAG
jgi:serine/threonine-protein kinase RsbW